VAAIMYEGNEACRGLVRSSIVKIAGNGLEEAILKTHLCVRKAWWISTELPDWELDPHKGILAMGSNED
jgi:hypothetical protein